MEVQYRYTIGGETDYNKIINVKNRIKKDFPDAFIIAIKKGKIIPLSEVIKNENKN